MVAEGDFRRLYFYLWSRRCGFSRAQLPYKSCPEKLCDRPIYRAAVDSGIMNNVPEE